MNDSKLLFKRMGTIVESTRSRTRLMQQADACITLPLRGFGMMDFLELAPLIEQGDAGSIAPLQEWIGKSGMAAAYGQATDRRAGPVETLVWRGPAESTLSTSLPWST